MAAGLVGSLFGGKKNTAATPSTSPSATPGPIVKALDPNDPLRRKSKGPITADPRSGIATILSDKLGN